MKAVNQTPFPTHVQREYPEDRYALVDATTKVTLDVGTAGALSVSREQLPVHVEGHADAPLGEVRYRRSDSIVEMTVVGSVVPSGSAGLRAAEVVLRVGSTERRLRVSGPRSWQRHGAVLRMSEPFSCASVEMAWANAYGGTKKTPAGFLPGTTIPAPSTELAWAANPGGCGFFRDERDAEGGALPQLELPETAVKSWDDRPQPGCWAPLPINSSLRMAHVAIQDERLRDRSGAARIHERMSMNAPPELQFEALHPGTRIVLEGFLGAEAFGFELPHAPFRWRCEAGSRAPTFEAPKLAAVQLRPNEGRISLLYRTRVIAPLIKHERRESTQEPSEQAMSLVKSTSGE